MEARIIHYFLSKMKNRLYKISEKTSEIFETEFITVILLMINFFYKHGSLLLSYKK
jgi:hypothetical protein